MSRTTWKERWQRFAAWHPFEHILTGGAALGMILPVVFWIVADPGYTNLIVDMLFTDLLPAAGVPQPGTRCDRYGCDGVLSACQDRNDLPVCRIFYAADF